MDGAGVGRRARGREGGQDGQRDADQGEQQQRPVPSQRYFSSPSRHFGQP
jgi:hypothetical protein